MSDSGGGGVVRTANKKNKGENNFYRYKKYIGMMGMKWGTRWWCFGVVVVSGGCVWRDGVKVK